MSERRPDATTRALDGAHLHYAARPLPPGAIRPDGWLRAQLVTQANGLTGHLDEFWPDVKESGWFGGSHEGWERAPYWLDGLIPLAFGLHDDRLIAKARRYVEYIVEHRHDDGWIGPVQQSQDGHETSSRDPWPVFVALKALTQYADATGDLRTFAAIRGAIDCIARDLDRKPLFEWGKYRYQDFLLSVYWLYERTGDEELIELAERVHNQGYDWTHHFRHFIFTSRSQRWQFDTHVVNNAQGIKAPAVWGALHPEEFDRAAVLDPIAVLDRYHGQANGMFTGDECLAGLMPSQGTELCAVVEYMFSLECMACTALDARIGDRLERVAYNALPATHTADMWAHQYDQQVNQAQCAIAEDHVYTTNHADSNIYGLEPNYGCCTANMHQGFPKLLQHLWLREPDGGLASLAYAPCTVTLPVSGASLSVRTSYPFDDEVVIEIHTAGRLPLSLRIPSWTHDPTATVETAGERETVKADAGTYLRLDRDWSAGATIRLRFPARITANRRYNHAVNVERGPIVFALRMSERFRRVAGIDPHSDWEVVSASPWNVALRLDPDHPENDLQLEHAPLDGDVSPFAPARHASDGAESSETPMRFVRPEPPLRLVGHSAVVPGWTLEHGAAAPPPPSPIEASAPAGGEQPCELIPYGCTSLRIAELPWYRGARA